MATLVLLSSCPLAAPCGNLPSALYRIEKSFDAAELRAESDRNLFESNRIFVWLYRNEEELTEKTLIAISRELGGAPDSTILFDSATCATEISGGRVT